MKKVKVICPRCRNIMTYKNYFSWILHTPFHWFNRRLTKCARCRRHFYAKREK